MLDRIRVQRVDLQTADGRDRFGIDRRKRDVSRGVISKDWLGVILRGLGI